MPKKQKKSKFFYHFALPKPSQTPSEIEKKSMKNQCKKRKRKNEAKYAPRAPKTPQERAIKPPMRDIPPAPLRLFYPMTERDAKALSGTP